MLGVRVIPCPDVEDGRVVKGVNFVRLRDAGDPVEQARAYNAAGADELMFLDITASTEGRGALLDVVSRTAEACFMPLSVGGGVRTLAAIEGWLEAGVRRVILGTVALSDPDLVREAARRFPERIVVGIDARDGRVAVDGWTRTSDTTAIELARMFEDAGVAALIVTDIARDGTLTGVGTETTGAVADAVDLPVIASGGVASVDDLRGLKARPGRPIAGAVLGRALYEGRFTGGEGLAGGARC